MRMSVYVQYQSLPNLSGPHALPDLQALSAAATLTSVITSAVANSVTSDPESCVIHRLTRITSSLEAATPVKMELQQATSVSAFSCGSRAVPPAVVRSAGMTLSLN
ncbi:unnamed protein product [Phytophthora fragariaefolia]|uniref:Unnamed protein product n=1 Tax=Phytophthora fragariaefolia TaxID=1490495 RepID=A0A9W6XNQ9_9STRA|nr:unnamed protein product [Phytophthora fragariaefolia]